MWVADVQELRRSTESATEYQYSHSLRCCALATMLKHTVGQVLEAIAILGGSGVSAIPCLSERLSSLRPSYCSYEHNQ